MSHTVEYAPRDSILGDSAVTSLRSGQTLQVQIIDPLVSPTQWDEIAAGFADCHVFHGAAWARVLSHSYGHRPFYVAALDAGLPMAALPVMEVTSRLTGKRGVSIPFSDFCAPLFASKQALEAAISYLLEVGHSRGWSSLHLHGSYQSPSPGASVANATFYSHVLDLRSSEIALFAQCEPSVRRAIRKAKKLDISVKHTASREALLTFYHLHCRTRRRHGLPPQPWKFFDCIHREFILPGNGSMFAAQKGSRTIAAAIFLTSRDKILYKFAASDARFQELRANNLLLWEAIRFYASQGAQTLHFGRTDLSDRGLRRFKLGWGSREELLQYSRFDFSRHGWSLERPAGRGIHNLAFRRMPLIVNRLAGAMIYPHLD